MRHRLILALLSLCTLQMWGVEIVSRKLNSASGLPDDNVRSLLQDSRGFIWLGTPGGLYRYDGYFFTTYKYMEEGNNRLLNNNHITGLYRLGDDRLLVSEQGGQYSVYDVRQNRFLDVPEAEKQQLYANCRKKRTDERLLAPHRQTIANGGGVITDNLGNMVVLDNTGLVWFIDRKTGETIQMRVFDQAMWPLVSSKKYKVVTSEKRGLVWVSTNGGGITLYDRKAHTEQHIRAASGLVSTDYIVDMCLDQDDNVWVADEFHGVACLSVVQGSTDVRLLAPEARGLRDNQVYIMRWLADSTLLVANTSGDVYKADRELNVDPKPAYQGLDIHSVCSDKQGRTWIGTRQRGLMTGDRQWYKHEPSDLNSVSADNIYYLLCDRDGRIWVACEDSYLDLAVRHQDGSVSFRHFFGKQFSARVMYQDKRGVIWVGTKNGLYAFRPEELLRDTSAYEHPLTGADLGYSDVSSICEDSRGTLWIGTVGSGVYAREAGDGAGGFSRNTRFSLISNDVQAILEDQKGVMWFATKNGLTSYNPATHKERQHYDESNLLRNYYADNCACLLPDGRLAFGTNSGIVICSPWKMAAEEEIHNRLDITEFTHDENALTVRFSAFNYRHLAAVRYAYWLEGYDRGWSEPSGYSFASYRHLPPGHYVLHIKAYGPGQQTDAEKTMAIEIARPWWQTWWAYLIYLLIAGGFSYAVYRQLRTIYNLRQRISVEKQLTEYKLQFFTNISHEFRTPLTIIRGAMERIKSQPSIPAEMRQPVSNMDKSVNRMLRLVNQLLEFRKMQNDKLRLALEETDVVKFLKEIFQNFWDITENKHINYTFSTPEKSRMMYVDRAHLDKIVYNVLSNAFKYTPSHGDVKLRLGFTDDRMQIRIEDTGVGIPKEKQPELFQRFMQSTFSNNSIGIGLNLTKALVEVHHGHISYEPNLPKGSVFIIELPTDASVYAEEDFLAAGASLLRSQETEEGSQDYHYQELAPEPMNDREVLIVEDDSDVIDYLRSILQRYFVVHTAMDGVEALEMLAAMTPDLIISDIMMPVMDGLEFTMRIRADERLKETPVILLTALNSDDKRIKAVENGADAYITKPFDPQLLISSAVSLIQQRDMLKGRYAQKVEGVKAELPEIIVDERDKKLLDVFNLWLADHLSNPMLSVDDMAEAMGYRRTVFYKRVKALTGQTPADYLKTLRMNRAAELLKEETVTVAEVCYQVGISDPHYFAKIFKQQFGISPKKYQQGGA